MKVEEIRFEDETTQNTEEKIKLLKAENELLKGKLEFKGIAPAKIGLSLLIAGIALLALSILANSLVLAFIGLGLAFWGMLFFLIRPIKFVRSDILGSTIAAYYYSVDRMLADLKYKGKVLYVPPFPTKVDLPEHLRGLKDIILYFPSTPGGKIVPSMNELAERKFLITDPRGMVLAPPGLGLVTLFEKELQLSPSQNDVESLVVVLSRIIVDDLQLAREVKFKFDNNNIQLTIVDSAYKELFDQGMATKSVYIIGCPLVSAIAIKLVKMTGRIIAVSEYDVFEKGLIIRVLLRFEGEE